MPNASDYVLRVTAGPSYDVSTHHIVAVNVGRPTKVKSPRIEADVTICMQNFHGLPNESPETSSYFSESPHEHDLYSIAFKFRLSEDISGNEVYWGNDFDEPIRNNLPPGINTALRIVRWGIDPGLDGDVYADKPYLYGPLLSSINVLRIGRKEDEDEFADSQEELPDSHEEDLDSDEDLSENDDGDDNEVPTEGASGSGKKVRREHGLPPTSAARMKHFLTEANRQKFMFEKGREYTCDFFNPYLDFNEFALKLPGFSLGIMRFWDGQPLRYTLKHRTADASIDEVLFVVQVTLIHMDQVEAEAEKWGDDTAAAKEASAQLKQAGERRRKSFSEAATATGEYEDEGVD